MFKLFTAVAAVILFSVGAVFAGGSYSEEHSFSAVLEAGSNLIINNINGDITIEEWDSDNLLIDYIIKSDDLEEIQSIDVIFERIDGILCEVTYPYSWECGTDAEVNFYVKLPQALNLNLAMQTVNGSISLKNGVGTSLIEIINGSAVLEGFSGDLTVNVISGEIELIDVPGLSMANIVNGTIRGTIDNVDRDVEILTISGLIDLVIESTASVSVTTISGEIDIPGVEIIENLVGSSAEYGHGLYTIDITTVSADIIIRR